MAIEYTVGSLHITVSYANGTDEQQIQDLLKKMRVHYSHDLNGPYVIKSAAMNLSIRRDGLERLKEYPTATQIIDELISVGARPSTSYPLSQTLSSDDNLSPLDDEPTLRP